jgi:hypothetical protein
MLLPPSALQRAAAILIVGVVLVVTLGAPAWCVATGLWWVTRRKGVVHSGSFLPVDRLARAT